MTGCARHENIRARLRARIAERRPPDSFSEATGRTDVFLKSYRLLVFVPSLALIPLLQGCIATSTAVAVQAVPMVVGGVAMNNLDDRQPFNSQVKYVGPRNEEELEELTRRLEQAECGDCAPRFLHPV